MSASLTTSLSRRDLLKAGGGLVIGFAWSTWPSRGAAQSPASASDGKPLDPSQVDSFLAIHPDGTVTVYTSKPDVGQGLRIAMMQLVAEELGVPVGRLSIVDGDTAVCPDQGGTGGSTGLTRGGTELRSAAATARRTLIALGAARLNRPAADLTIADGEVRPLAGGTGIGIGTLVTGRRLNVKVDSSASLVAPARYTTVGRPLLRPDVKDKCTAKHVYVHDVSVPGMVHARIVRAPAIGAKLVNVDEASIGSIPGVRVVRVNNFLAVVSKDEWAAVRAADTLKSIWSEGQRLPGHEGLEKFVREGALDRDQPFVNKGDAPAAMAGTTTRFEASYFWPNQSHASLAPSCAVADVKADGSATIWSASQGPNGLRAALARTFGLNVEKVRVVFCEGSGSYGTNGGDYAAADAVLISKTIGEPVRVQWSRQDELGWDPKGPQQLIDVRAGLDASGRIVAWDAEMWVPAARQGGRAYLAAEAAGIGQDNGQNGGQLSQNADPPYTADNVRVLVHNLKDTPLVISNLRAPGKIANVFAAESFTDEIASALKVDPVAFRLSRLSDPRAVEAVTRTARAFGWQERPSPNPRARQGRLLIGRGIAYMRYKQAENYVAMAMDIAVDAATGAINVRRVVCAHDCGLVVNPDGLKNQIEGCIVQTLSRTLYEEVKFDRSRVTSVDWASYPVLRFPDAPSIEVLLIDRPTEPLMGAGEAATAPVAAALGNAFFDATGVRLRAVPFTAERVKRALGSRT